MKELFFVTIIVILFEVYRRYFFLYRKAGVRIKLGHVICSLIIVNTTILLPEVFEPALVFAFCLLVCCVETATFISLLPKEDSSKYLSKEEEEQEGRKAWLKYFLLLIPFIVISFSFSLWRDHQKNEVFAIQWEITPTVTITNNPIRVRTTSEKLVLENDGGKDIIFMINDDRIDALKLEKGDRIKYLKIDRKERLEIVTLRGETYKK